jgi:hypothetical protein
VKAGEGQQHLDILRQLASPSCTVDPTNHALPLLGELQKDDMIFAIFPLVASYNLGSPWFFSVEEVFDAVEQVFEVRRLLAPVSLSLVHPG